MNQKEESKDIKQIDGLHSFIEKIDDNIKLGDSEDDTLLGALNVGLAPNSHIASNVTKTIVADPKPYGEKIKAAEDQLIAIHGENLPKLTKLLEDLKHLQKVNTYYTGRLILEKKGILKMMQHILTTEKAKIALLKKDIEQKKVE